MSKSLEIAILQHEDASPAGLFGEWAVARGHRLETFDVPRLAAWPRAGAHDLVVSLGSDCSVHASTDPWIAAEIEFLRAAREAGAGGLGICFGGQIFAAAFGGRAYRAARVDAGWRTVASADLDLLTPGPWFCWHEDAFSTPPGGRELARDELGTLAYQDDGWIGIQFHPEADAAILEGWMGEDTERLLGERVDVARLRREAVQAAPRAPELAYDLFDRLAPAWEGA